MKHPSRRAVLLSAGGAALAAFAKIRGVELGVCGKAESFAEAGQYGFDYFEPGAAAIAAMSEPAFASFKDQVLGRVCGAGVSIV